MALPNLNIGSSYNTSKDDLIKSFFEPLLQNSISCDRGVGYFSSGWLSEAFIGMADFIRNGGRARWITSPILSKEDWNALVLGDSAKHDEILKQALEISIDDLQQTLKNETLIAFAWLLADGLIEFKLAKPRKKLSSEFHAKVGIFTDNFGDSISFDGSYNDSINGLRNYESLKVFKSWDSSSDYLEQEKKNFELLWNNQDPNVEIYEIPRAIKEKILKLIEHTSRPYKKHETEMLKSYFDLINIETPSPNLPSNIKLRDYQLEAIQEWFLNKNNGIFEMATGTGKTITALAAAVKLFSEKNRLFTIVLCPYIHLGKQWQKEAEEFGFRPVLVAESKSKWIEKITKLARDFSAGRIKQGSIITTNASFQRGDLIDILASYGVWDNTLLIADEMHHCGSLEMMKRLPRDVPYRLGLSATPVREYDESGTDALLNYFGDIVFKFDLEKAINFGFLTRYFYHPTPVNLIEEEFDQYIELSNQFSKLHPDPRQPISDAALRIAVMRASVLNNSISKVEWLNSNVDVYNEMVYTIFYSGDKIFSQVRQLLGCEKGMLIHEFTHKQSMKDREKLLEMFSKKELQALVAMKCLDEGVDIPPTRTAYFLASSSVSREFVQRRGRILRNSPGKEYAKVIDLVSIPPEVYIRNAKVDGNYRVVRSALKRELSRVREFSMLAENKHSSMEGFLDLANKFDLLDL